MVGENMRIIIVSSILLHIITAVYAAEYNVDMENTGVCTMAEPAQVSSTDIYNLFAQPAQSIEGLRDRCTVKLVGTGDRKFKFFIRDLQFLECGIKVKIYDGDMNLNQARFEFGCNDSPGQVVTSFTNRVAVSLEKADASRTGYKFYVRVATSDGPDITEAGPRGVIPGSEGLSTGIIAGIAVGCVLVVLVLVAVAIYCIKIYRDKKDEQIAKAYSMNSLLPSAASLNKPSRGSSVHSSVHSSKHSTHNSALAYPALRNTISAQHGKCQSIDTRSYDSEAVDSAPKPIKNVTHEFDSMKRGIDRDERRDIQKERDMYEHEMRWKEAKKVDREIRSEPSRGFGRSNRRDRSLLTEDNLKQSLRQARNKGRSLSGRPASEHSYDIHGSSRSRSKHKGHRDYRGESHSDYNYSERYDDDDRYSDRDRSRSRTKSQSSGRGQRSASAGSLSRRRKNYEDYDHHSDYEHRRHHSKDRLERDYRDSASHRSGTQRSRSHSYSNGRKHR